MLLRIIALFFISFPILAAQDTNSVENKVKHLNRDVAAINKAFKGLEHRVERSISNNEQLILESRDMLKGINKSIKRQDSNQNDILNALAQAKVIKEREADLVLSVKPTYEEIGANFFAVILTAIGSIWVTFLILKKTLAKETDIQIKSLQENLTAQTKLHKQQIDTQLQLSIRQHEKDHLLTVDEFRQKWINTFRQDISIFIGYIVAVVDFHSVEADFFDSWKRAKKAKEARINYFKEELNELNEERTPWNYLKKQNQIYSSECYKDFLADEHDAKESFDKYKDELKEFKKLHSLVTQQKLKTILMLNPNKHTKDNEISKTIDLLVNVITLHDRTYLQPGTVEQINLKLIELQSLVQHMLKGEWDRIQKREQP